MFAIFVFQDETCRQVGERAEACGLAWLRTSSTVKCGHQLDTKWVSRYHPAAGYDAEVDGGVFSPEWMGRRCFVEIKGSSSSEMKLFTMSSNEYNVMMGKDDGEYIVLIVTGVNLHESDAGAVTGSSLRRVICKTM